MRRNDITGAFKAADLWTAFGLLTRLPLPYPAFDPESPRPAAYAAWAYPLVGLVVGGGGALMAWLALGLGVPASLTALLVLISTMVITGALHEDGLADCADGFWGGWTAARRLEIMKDSQIGTYGVSALVLSLGLRWQAVSLLIGAEALVAALLCAAVMSRGAMVWVMYHLPVARQKGLSGKTGRPSRASVGASLCMTVLAAVAMPAAALAIVLITALLVGGISLLARAKIGGQTGDVLGATQQIVEIGVLITLASVLT